MREAKGGRAARPANCVAPWEAMKYCEWVGKRLPTEVEWEFAARSRKSDYACSWGGGVSNELECDRSGPETNSGPMPVCGSPDDDTEQGLCDMMGNVAELVTHVAVPGRPALVDCPYNVVSRGAQWGKRGVMPFLPHSCRGMNQHIGVGFRCARDSRER
jgi:formylglycine-generating enzyme required for sulfatase activity